MHQYLRVTSSPSIPDIPRKYADREMRASEDRGQGGNIRRGVDEIRRHHEDIPALPPEAPALAARGHKRRRRVRQLRFPICVDHESLHRHKDVGLR